MNVFKTVSSDQFKLLSFRRFKPNLVDFRNWYLGFGLMTAWLAGVGRYWDNPKAELWQFVGLGSVIYCFFLAAVIYLLLLPMRPKNWSYSNILIFISLTSLPAFLYAIPVERFTSLATAQRFNLWFLFIVALWRVLLFINYLKRSASLSGAQILVGSLLPIVIIINLLTFLNLEHVVFQLMAGLRESEPSANDTAYMALWLITLLSNVLLPVLLIMYLWFIGKAWKSRKEKKIPPS